MASGKPAPFKTPLAVRQPPRNARASPRRPPAQPVHDAEHNQSLCPRADAMPALGGGGAASPARAAMGLDAAPRPRAAARPLAHAHAHAVFAPRSRAHGRRQPLLQLLRGLQRVHGQGGRPGRVRTHIPRLRAPPPRPGAFLTVAWMWVGTGASCRARTTSSACTTARR